jgi:predicted mannosyl-3-phosphoglycerate phosphatase (HAD superfamily)
MCHSSGNRFPDVVETHPEKEAETGTSCSVITGIPANDASLFNCGMTAPMVGGLTRAGRKNAFTPSFAIKRVQKKKEQIFVGWR